MKTLLTILLLLSSNAFAWGPTGHRAVGEIATGFLDSKVAQKVHKILEGRSLARVANWPDEIKSEPQTYKYTFNWHYTDWPEEMQEHNEHNSAGILLTSISEQLKTLKHSGATKEQKAFALKFLVHLVGDLHQPLHVGNGLDMGGNTCKVIFQKTPTNLHALWDEGMIDFTRLSFTELAKFVKQGSQTSDLVEWRKGGPLDWALESKKIRETIYPDNVASPLGPVSIRQFCRKDIAPTEAEMPKLGFEYSYKFLPVVEKRLLQAGVRLAKLLNENL